MKRLHCLLSVSLSIPTKIKKSDLPLQERKNQRLKRFLIMYVSTN